jgi:hypothetical protein
MARAKHVDADPALARAATPQWPKTRTRDGPISQAGFRKTMKGRAFSGLPFLLADRGFAVAEDVCRGDANPEANGMSVKTAGSWQIIGVWGSHGDRIPERSELADNSLYGKITVKTPQNMREREVNWGLVPERLAKGRCRRERNQAL